MEAEIQTALGKIQQGKTVTGRRKAIDHLFGYLEGNPAVLTGLDDNRIFQRHQNVQWHHICQTVFDYVRDVVSTTRPPSTLSATFAQLAKVLHLADARFQQCQTFMLDDLYHRGFVTNILGMLETCKGSSPLPEHLIPILLKRVLPIERYAITLEADGIDRLLRLALKHVRMVALWDEPYSQLYMQVLRWICCSSPKRLQEHVHYINAQQLLQHTFQQIIRDLELTSDFMAWGTLANFLESLHSYFAQLAIMSQGHAFQFIDVTLRKKLLSLLLHRKMAGNNARHHLMQVFRLLATASSCLYGTTVPLDELQQVASDLPHLLHVTVACTSSQFKQCTLDYHTFVAVDFVALVFDQCEPLGGLQTGSPSKSKRTRSATQRQILEDLLTSATSDGRAASLQCLCFILESRKLEFASTHLESLLTTFSALAETRFHTHTGPWALRCLSAALVQHRQQSLPGTHRTTQASTQAQVNATVSLEESTESIVPQPSFMQHAVASAVALVHRHLQNTASMSPALRYQLLNVLSECAQLNESHSLDLLNACLDHDQPLCDFDLTFAIKAISLGPQVPSIVQKFSERVCRMDLMAYSRGNFAAQRAIPSSNLMAAYLLACLGDQEANALVPVGFEDFDAPSEVQRDSLAQVLNYSQVLGDRNPLPDCIQPMQRPRHSSDQAFRLISLNMAHSKSILATLQTWVQTCLSRRTDVESQPSLQQMAEIAYCCGVVWRVLGKLSDASDLSTSDTGHDTTASSISAGGSLELATLFQELVECFSSCVRQLCAPSGDFLSTSSQRTDVSRLLCHDGLQFLDAWLMVYVDRPDTFRGWRGQKEPDECPSPNTLPQSHFFRTHPTMGCMRRLTAALCDMARQAMQLQPQHTLLGADAGFEDSGANKTSLEHAAFNLFVPRHKVEKVQLQTLDIMHAWRQLACHPESQFTSDMCGLALADDSFIKDEKCPLLVFITACQSLAAVAPTDETERWVQTNCALTAVCDVEFNSLITESNFELPAFFNTTLDMLTRLVPRAFIHADHPSTPRAQDLQRLQNMVQQEVATLWKTKMPRKWPREWHTQLCVSQRIAMMNVLFTLFSCQFDNWFAFASDFECKSIYELLLFARDRHHLCRIHAARLLPWFVQGLSADLQPTALSTLKNISLRVLSPLTPEEDESCETLQGLNDLEEDAWAQEVRVHAASAVLCLGNVAHRFPEALPDLLFVLFREATNVLGPLVRASLDTIAAAVGWKNTEQLLEQFLPQLLLLWLQYPMVPKGAFPFAQFPYSIFVAKGLRRSACQAAFFEKHFASMLVVVFTNQYGLEWAKELCKLASKDLETEVSSHFERVMAFVYTTKAVESDFRHAIDNVQRAAALNGDDLGAQHQSHLLSILCCMLDIAQAERRLKPDALSLKPVMQLSLARQVVSSVLAKGKLTTLAALFAHNQFALIDLLLSMANAFQSMPVYEEKLAHFKKFQWFVEQAVPCFGFDADVGYSPAISAVIASSTLLVSETAQLSDVSVPFLAKLFSASLQSQVLTKPLLHLFPRMVSVLATHASQSTLPHHQLCIDALDHLVGFTKRSHQLRPMLPMLTPLLHLEALSHVHAHLASMMTDMAPTEHIVKFIEQAQASNYMTSVAAVTELHTWLTQILTPASEPQVMSRLFVCLWHVLQHTSTSQALRAALTKCIATMGAVWKYNPAVGQQQHSAGPITNEFPVDIRLTVANIIVRLQKFVFAADACRAIPALQGARAIVLPCKLGKTQRRTLSDIWVMFAGTSNILEEKYDTWEPNLSQHVDREVWNPCGKAFDRWLRDLITGLLTMYAADDQLMALFTPLVPLCLVDGEFCEFLLPYVVIQALQTDPQHSRRLAIQQQLNAVFSSVQAGTPVRDLRGVRCLLSLVDALRLTTFEYSVTHGDRPSSTPASTTHWSSLKWLCYMDFVAVAHACQVCGLYYSALLYAEIQLEQEDTPHLQRIRADSLAALGELDAVNPLLDPLDPQQHATMYEREGKHFEALGAFDILAREEPKFQPRAAQASQHLGLTATTAIMLKAAEGDGFDDEAMFESCWKLGQWDFQPSRQSTTVTRNATIFQSLKGLETGLTAVSVSPAMLRVIDELPSFSVEDTQSVQRSLLTLQLLHEVDTCQVLVRDFSLHHDQFALQQQVSSLCSQWDIMIKGAPREFERRDTILHLRYRLLHALWTVSETDQHQWKAWVAPALDHLWENALEHHQYQHALNTAAQMRQALGSHTSSWLLAHSQTLWHRGEQDLAVRMLEVAQRQSRDAPDKADILCQLGTWYGSLQAHKPAVVIEDYLEAAIQHCSSDEQRQTSLQRLAAYADEQCQILEEKMASADYIRSVDIMNEHMHEREQLLRTTGGSEFSTLPTHRQREIRRRLRTLSQRIPQEERMHRNLEESRKMYLTVALRSYIDLLTMSYETETETETTIFRVFSLWFNNTDGAHDLQARWERFPSQHWLPLAYQLAARIEAAPSPLQILLQSIIRKVAVDHPFHMLFVLIALKNGTGNVDKAQNSPDAKMLAASKLLDRISRDKSRRDMAQLVSKMQTISDAYTELAYIPKGEMSQSYRLARIKAPEVPILTRVLAVDPSCEYEDFVGINFWRSRYDEAGGINKPKIIELQGTDGTFHREVVKGNDDSRQDSVMQQVFGMVNKWLEADPSCNKRHLRIRTYKIIPLSQTVGVLQWCLGTMPLGSWLPEAHRRYFPKDWKSSLCRERMKNAKKYESTIEEQANPDSRLNTYTECCENFHPVFRRFFTESFPDPSEWFEARRTYTQSVATNSMMGYIIGLGDRHPNNILIDKETAELVHIDLGVAFEQGKALTTPETVPFRLTRDIVDGMGNNGVEGSFRRCCEVTLTVLCKSKNHLATLLGVFLFDPLRSWRLTPLKAQHVQHADSDGASILPSTIAECPTTQLPSGSREESEAKRVLITVTQKLSNMHEGIPLSVAGHVNALIRDATSTENLSVLFPGWQPWL
eukprot:m.158278 g.158278  ORF g.158278 m.158278 type:complete len:2964 (+) comp14338_c0_seq6:294-9185(+)